MATFISGAPIAHIIKSLALVSAEIHQDKGNQQRTVASRHRKLVVNQITQAE